jgi:hypothetical protein
LKRYGRRKFLGKKWIWKDLEASLENFRRSWKLDSKFGDRGGVYVKDGRAMD